MVPLTADPPTSTTVLVLLSLAAVFVLALATSSRAKRASERRKVMPTLTKDGRRRVKEINRLSADFITRKNRLWHLFDAFGSKNVKAFGGKADEAYRMYKAEKKSK